jgi:DNA-directed RNA polymerase specialized sigma54-like protein
VAEPIVEAPSSPETADERESQTSPAEAELDKVIPDDPKDKNEIDWESYLEEGFDLGDKRTEELESPDERFEKVPVYSKTLQDHLLGQLQDRTVPPEVQPLVEYLINSLDERGYLVFEIQPGPEPAEDHRQAGRSRRRCA